MAWSWSAVEGGVKAEALGLTEKTARGGLEQPRRLSEGHLHCDRGQVRDRKVVAVVRENERNSFSGWGSEAAVRCHSPACFDWSRGVYCLRLKLPGIIFLRSSFSGRAHYVLR